MSPFSWQGQNLCGLSLAFILDWRVVTYHSIFRLDVRGQNFLFEYLKNYLSCDLNCFVLWKFGIFVAIGSWFHVFMPICRCMRAFSNKKLSKILFPAQRQNWHFAKNIKNYLILTKNCDQTTWPTMNHKASLERQCPYLSSGTFGFEICPPIRSQLPCENQGPLTSSQEIQWYVHIL